MRPSYFPNANVISRRFARHIPDVITVMTLGATLAALEKQPGPHEFGGPAASLYRWLEVIESSG